MIYTTAATKKKMSQLSKMPYMISSRSVADGVTLLVSQNWSTEIWYLLNESAC